MPDPFFTEDRIRESAKTHVAYGWSKRPWGDWTDEQKRIYSDAYDAAKKSRVTHA